MADKEIIELYRQTLGNIFEKKLGDALANIELLKQNVQIAEVHDRFSILKHTYSNMLKYSFEFAPDPQREKIYQGLQRSLIELCDDIFSYRNDIKGIITNSKPSLEWVDFNTISRDEFAAELMSYELSPEEYINPENQINRGLHDFTDKLFYAILFSGKLKESAVEMIQEFLHRPQVPDPDKCMLVSALTLSGLRHFDMQKIFILFEAYGNQEPEVSQRALIGFIFCVLSAEGRISFYPEIQQRIKSFPEFDQLQNDVMAVLIQFFKSQDTEKIAKKLQEEILPEVMKIRSELEDKLKLEDILSQKSNEDKNPEWESVFKDSPDVYEKLEQFSQMQVDGSDVFMSAFAMLKHFDFFQSLSNWFLPFSKNEPNIREISKTDFSIDFNAFLEGLEGSNLLCNSDKFSFCLNIKYMPEQQRKTMLELFKMELEAMNELAKDEEQLDANKKKQTVITQYTQDLYRFFKLHPNRSVFHDLFNVQIDVLDAPLFKMIFEGHEPILHLAEYYFERDKFEEALPLFEHVSEIKPGFELFEKLGYCAQRNLQFRKAIYYYHQAELFDKEKVWLKKKLGFCYRKVGEYDQAINYYQSLEVADPDNIEVQAYLGQLHIDVENYEKALEHYYKVEYLQPDLVKVQRPIGWCSLITGKIEKAQKYFQKVADAVGVPNDYLNLGHAFWAGGDVPKAIENYKLAASKAGSKDNWLYKAMKNDSKYLTAFGIQELDVSLMLDYLGEQGL